MGNVLLWHPNDHTTHVTQYLHMFQLVRKLIWADLL